MISLNGGPGLFFRQWTFMSSSTSHEIIVTRPGTDMMTAYRKAPKSAKPRSHPKLVRAYRELARDKRVSRPPY